MDDNAEKTEETPTNAQDESNTDTETPQKNDVKSGDAAIAPPKDVADATAEAGSNKRAREDDDGVEDQRDPKKVDSKAEES